VEEGKLLFGQPIAHRKNTLASFALLDGFQAGPKGKTSPDRLFQKTPLKPAPQDQ